jgi:hypothetical protein
MWKTFTATIRRPEPERGDPGQIEEGRYRTRADGTLEVEDATGKRIDAIKLAPDADPLVAARRLVRDKRGGGDFHAPVRYPRRGIV